MTGSVDLVKNEAPRTFGLLGLTHAERALKFFLIWPVCVLVIILILQLFCFLCSGLFMLISWISMGCAHAMSAIGQAIQFLSVFAGSAVVDIVTKDLFPFLLGLWYHPIECASTGVLLLLLSGRRNLNRAIVFNPVEGLSVEADFLVLRRQLGTEFLKWSDISHVELKKCAAGAERNPCLIVTCAGWNYEIPLRYITDAASRSELMELLRKKLHVDQLSASLFDDNQEDNSFTRMWFKCISENTKKGEVRTLLLSGAKLREGKYTVEQFVGESAETSTYVVSNGSETPQQFILKELITPSEVPLLGKNSAIESMQRELGILRRLDHRRIVKLCDSFIEGKGAYVVLEKVDGFSLRQRVEERGGYSEHDVKTLAIQICDALKYLHTRIRPVVHRDCTPDNLILSIDKKKVTLVDFSSASYSTGTACLEPVGKYSYVPLEQLEGLARPASDIYAFGATMYFLLTGKDPDPLSEAHPARESPTISQDMDSLVADCTRADWEKRPTTLEIRERLRAIEFPGCKCCSATSARS